MRDERDMIVKREEFLSIDIDSNMIYYREGKRFSDCQQVIEKKQEMIDIF